MKMSGFLLLALVGHVLSSSVCPAGFDFDGEDKCYLVLEGSYLSYDDADAHCRAFGGVVANIENDFQFNCVQSRATPNNYYFLAAKEISDGRYVWPDGKDVQKKFYISGQPIVGSGPCTSFLKNANSSGILPDDCDIVRVHRGVMCQAVPLDSCSPDLFVDTQHSMIYSVNYGDHYYNNMNCTYTLRAPSDQQVTMIFTDFRVEDFWDYVNVYDGSTNGQLLARIIASTPNTMVQSISNKMVMQFVTDDTIYGVGWSADFYMGNAPAPITISTSSGSITSPNYPNYYPQYTTQVYYLNYNADNFHYGLNFTSFNLSPSDCLFFYEHSPWTGSTVLQGVPTTPLYITTSTTNLMILFTSSGTNTNFTGFDMAFSILPN